MDLPLTLQDGFPEQDRGAVAGHPGLYVVGLPFIRSLSSALLGGVGRDAAVIAEDIAQRIHDRAVVTGAGPAGT